MAITIPSIEDHADLRDAVRALCQTFDGAYWRRIDEERSYPEAFCRSTDQRRWLAALIPEEFAGRGSACRGLDHHEEINNRSGGNSGAVHGQMYNMSTILTAGSAAQKQKYLPEIAAGRLRMQSMAVTEPTTGSFHTTSSRRPRPAMATAGSSTARRCGPRASSIPT